MATMSNEFDKAYTMAVALNNVGVSLVRRQCYQPAKHAFHSALLAIQEVSKSVVEDGEYKYISSHFDAVLQNSYSHIFQSQRDCRLAVADDTKFQVITEEESANVVSAVVLKPNFMDVSASFLIRMEFEGKSIQDCRYRDMAMESSIIMYNYGMLYKCLATTDATTEMALQRLKKASELFGLSFAVFQNPEMDYQNFYGRVHLLSLSILAICGLSYCASMLGLEKEEKEYHSKMLILRDFFF